MRRPHRTHRRRPHHLNGMRGPRRLDHRRPAQQPRPPLRVRGRRRGHQPQLRPQRLPYVPQEGRHRVGVQMPLMALVEHDDIHPGQLLIALEPLEQHTRGHDLHPRAPPHGPLPAYREAHALAGPLAQQPRHPPRRRTRRDPPRLGHHDPPRRTVPDQPRQHQRHQGRLAGTGRRHQDGGAVGRERVGQGRQGGAHGQRVQGVVTDHALSVVRRPNPPPRPRSGRFQSRSHTKTAVPGIRPPRSGDQPPHSELFQAGHSGSTRSTRRNPVATMSRTRSPSVLWCST